MSVLNRPLFLQRGGSAQPMPEIGPPPSPRTMAPGPAPMPPGAEAVQRTEQMAAAQGEKIGQDYAQRMMQGIDQAQSTEELINAFRGNDMPLEARRDELAGYVGEGDADKTPESVLAMVQPVIMMTEEGAMNSGIGNLMQQLTGDIDMMTEAGAPTDMGQGVGSLMMAGAPEAPAPQNFREGGAVVQRFNKAGEVSAAQAFSTESKAAYEGLAPLFSELINQQERDELDREREAFDRGQFFVSAAQGGLRLMAGIPEAGRSLASQVGAAFEPTIADLATIGAQARARKEARRKEDRALDLARLQAGISFTETERATRAAAEQKALDRQVELDKFLLGRDTKFFVDPSKPGSKPIAIPDIPSLIKEITQAGFVPYTNPTDTKAFRNFAGEMLSGGADSKYAKNELTERQLFELEQFLADEYRTITIQNKITGELEKTTRPIPPVTLAALLARKEKGLSIPTFNLSQLEGGVKTDPPPTGDQATEPVPGVPQPEVPADSREAKLDRLSKIAEQDPVVAQIFDITRGGADFSKALGVPGTFRRLRDKYINLFSLSQVGPMSPEQEELLALLKTNSSSAMTAALAADGGRDTDRQMRLIASVLPVQVDLDEDSSTYGQVLDLKNITINKFVSETKALMSQLKNKIQTVQSDINSPNFDRTQKKAKQDQISQLEASLLTWEGILLSAELSMLADDRAIRTDRSANLIESEVSRASGGN